jgi:hypothetical protein
LESIVMQVKGDIETSFSLRATGAVPRCDRSLTWSSSMFLNSCKIYK